MTNNGESIYKIRANFLKMKEHVTQTTRTTDENIIRCFVITFEYNITILLLLKGIDFHSIWFHVPSKYLIFNRYNYFLYDIQRPLFGIFLAICLHYISIKHIIFSNHSLGWFYYLAVHFCLTFIFYCFIVFKHFIKPNYNEYAHSGSQHLRNLF